MMAVGQGFSSGRGLGEGLGVHDGPSSAGMNQKVHPGPKVYHF